MTRDAPLVDEAGDKILKFVSAARNLSRLGELSDEVVTIAESMTWRRYRTAVGMDEWLECELDYFLIACELGHDDVGRIVAYTREGAQLAPMMDREAGADRRREFGEAAKAWHSPGLEGLIERAQRLGWTRSANSLDLRAAPLPARARARQAHGMTKDRHAQQSRLERLGVERQGELDALVLKIQQDISSDVERLYIIDQLRDARVEKGRGRLKATTGEKERWRADAERLAWKTDRLAEVWAVDPSTVRRRLKQLR